MKKEKTNVKLHINKITKHISNFDELLENEKEQTKEIKGIYTGKSIIKCKCGAIILGYSCCPCCGEQIKE